jgi:hypothetical protein
MMFRRNPNRAALRERYRALQAEQTAPPVPHFAGEIVRVTRDDGTIDTVTVITVWTAVASCIPMLTVAHHPRSISTFNVRADAVVSEDASGGVQ